jgi:hypothetical protein
MSSALVEPRALATAELHHHQLFLTLAPPSSSNAGGISGLASPTTGGILLVIMPNYKGNLVTLRVGVRQSRGELRFFWLPPHRTAPVTGISGSFPKSVFPNPLVGL